MGETDEREADPRGEFDEADVEDSRRIYLRTWAAGFRALLGWPEEKTLEWAERWSNALRDPGMSFYHDQPEKWMTSALIPEWLMEKFRRDLREGRDPGDHGYAHLRKRLIEAMVAAPGQEFKFVEEYDDRDWAEARPRVRAVLQDFGADLPETG